MFVDPIFYFMILIDLIIIFVLSIFYLSVRKIHHSLYQLYTLLVRKLYILHIFIKSDLSDSQITIKYRGLKIFIQFSDI